MGNDPYSTLHLSNSNSSTINMFGYLDVIYMISKRAKWHPTFQNFKRSQDFRISRFHIDIYLKISKNHVHLALYATVDS